MEGMCEIGGQNLYTAQTFIPIHGPFHAHLQGCIILHIHVLPKPLSDTDDQQFFFFTLQVITMIVLKCPFLTRIPLARIHQNARKVLGYAENCPVMAHVVKYSTAATASGTYAVHVGLSYHV